MMILVKIPALTDPQFRGIERVLYTSIPSALACAHYGNSFGYFYFTEEIFIPEALKQYIDPTPINKDVYKKIERDITLILDRWKIPQ